MSTINVQATSEATAASQASTRSNSTFAEERVMMQCGFGRSISNAASICMLVAFGLCGSAQASSPLDLLVTGHQSGNVLAYDDAGKFAGSLWNGPAGPGGTVPGAPIGIAVGPDGGIYVSTTYVDHISRLDIATHTLVPFTTGGTLTSPHQIAFGGPDNNLYSSDLGLNAGPPRPTVNVFSGTTGAFINSMALPYGADISSNGIAVDATGTVYVSNRVHGTIYRSSGASFDLLATVSGEVEGLTIGPDDKLYVGTRDQRVLRLSLDGTPYGLGGNLSDPTFINDSRLSGAFSVAFDQNNMMYVASAGTNEILRYGASGTFVDTFVSAKLGGLDYPVYMVFAPVPELSEWAMMSVGLVVIGLGMRRRAHHPA